MEDCAKRKHRCLDDDILKVTVGTKETLPLIDGSTDKGLCVICKLMWVTIWFLGNHRKNINTPFKIARSSEKEVEDTD